MHDNDTWRVGAPHIADRRCEKSVIEKKNIGQTGYLPRQKFAVTLRQGDGDGVGRPLAEAPLAEPPKRQKSVQNRHRGMPDHGRGKQGEKLAKLYRSPETNTCE